jgi:hypothetical protein
LMAVTRRDCDDEEVQDAEQGRQGDGGVQDGDAP